jgi:hypothetical protein
MATPLVNLRVSTYEREAWVRAAGGESLSRWIRRVCNEAAGGSPGRSTKVPDPDPPRRSVPEYRSDRVRVADEQVRALQREDRAPVVEPVSPAAAEGDPLYRVGRCRTHPAALPRIGDLTRCSWGCRLPDA